MKNKNIQDMIKELDELINENKEVCSKIVSKPKPELNGRQLPEKTRLAKKAG